MTEAPEASTWFVYVLSSEARPVTYVGIAKDVDARLAQHNGELPGGALSSVPWRKKGAAVVSNGASRANPLESACVAMKILGHPRAIGRSTPRSRSRSRVDPAPFPTLPPETLDPERFRHQSVRAAA